ncbi:hypothetical protein [Haloarchaeobius sp. TZWWS8]|uniref:hypothetical protein n=1 Tax=Haloarchaeobius sp. TZWWS8 TaxID=3446121 RepID=UPI003EC11658
MFDVTPPKIEVYKSNYVNVIKFEIDWDELEVGAEGEYTIAAAVDDPSGVRNFSVDLDDETKNQSSNVDSYVSAQVTVGTGQAFLNGLQTNRLSLTVADEHGNQKTVTAFTSSNFYIQGAEELEILNSLSDDEAAALGYASGISKSAGGMGETIQQMMSDPKGYVAQMADYKQYVELVKQADKLPGAMVQQYEQEMRVTNPYYDPRSKVVKNETNYAAFEKGYYAGVATFEVAASAGGGGALASNLKKVDKVQELASKPKVQKALSYYRKAQSAKNGAKSKYVTGPAARTGYRLASGVSSQTGVNSKTIHGMLGTVKTAGKQWRVTQAAKKSLNDGVYLGKKARRDAAKFLSRTDDDGLELIDEFDPETKRRFFEIGCSRAGGTASKKDYHARPGDLSSSTVKIQTSTGSCFDADRFRRALKQSYVQNGKVDVEGARKVIDKISSLSGQKQQRAALLVRNAAGEGGAEFLAKADRNAIDDVLSMEIRVSSPEVPIDLQERVRVGIVQAYSRNHFSRDGWAGFVYPAADSPADVAATIARDIRVLNDDKNVEGIGKALSSETGGPHLAGLSSPKYSNDAVKGVALELRVARKKADNGLDSGKFHLSYEPNVNLKELKDDGEALNNIAKKVYGTKEARVFVNDALFSSDRAKRIELDGFRTNIDGKDIYYESKNTIDAPSVDGIQAKASRYFASQKLRGKDLSDSKMIVYVRKQDIADTLNNKIDQDWFSAKAITESTSKPQISSRSSLLSSTWPIPSSRLTTFSISVQRMHSIVSPMRSKQIPISIMS